MRALVVAFLSGVWAGGFGAVRRSVRTRRSRQAVVHKAGWAWLVGLMLLTCGAALPRAGSAAVCNGVLEINHVAGPNPASPGDSVRVQVVMFTGAITGGTLNALTVNRLRFDLDCNGDNPVALSCTDDGSVIRYEGNITSSNCFDAASTPVTFTDNSGIGNFAPNEVIFTPSAPVVIAHDTANVAGCVLEFDVQVASLSNDSTPNAAEEVTGFRSASNDATCDNALSSGGTQSSPIPLKPPAVCGDGTIDTGLGETCDQGVANGQSTSCCDASCHLISGVCCQANGTVQPSGTSCRPAVSLCDVAEVCTGTSNTCPADQFKASNVQCRAVAGACDIAENCTGTAAACPGDAFKASTVTCRASACSGPTCCDVAEQCTGTAAACPADGFLSSTTVCRAQNGSCDVAELCTGTAAFCPADAFQPSTAICRAAAGECDVAERCTGTNTACPADGKTASGTPCTDDGNPCTADLCDGLSIACQHPAATCPGGRACVQPPSGMVAWYPMDDASGSEVKDILREHHNGTAGPGLLGSPDVPGPGGPLPGPGMVGLALTFDGTSTAVEVPDAPSLNFAGGDFSIDAWVKVDAPASAGVRPIVDKRAVSQCAKRCSGTTHPVCTTNADCAAVSAGTCGAAKTCADGTTACTTDSDCPAGGLRGYELFLLDGRLGFELADGASSDTTSAGPNVADGNPHHVAVTVRRSSTPTLTLYVDGTAVLTDLNPRTGSVDNGGNLLIAKSAIANLFFGGWIDELEIFSRVLDPTEVAAIFRAGAAGKCRALDHFLCYHTRNLPGAPPFSSILGLPVEDQFGASTVDLRKSVTLCAPANKNDEDPTAPAHADHLRSYPARPRAAFTTVTNQKVVNQFGTLFVDVLKASDLLVPTAKNLTGTPAAPLSPAVDHFLCHAIKQTRGAPKFSRISRVSVEDQFGTRLIDVIKPTRLCAPANKNGEDISAPSHPDHLLCYQAKLSKRVAQQPAPKQPKLVTQPFGKPIDPIYTNNQFGPEGIAAVRVFELCVPSLKNPADVSEEPCPDCDDGSFCTEDRCVESDPDPDDVAYEPSPPVCQSGLFVGLPCPPANCGAGNLCAAPTYMPPKEYGCEHDWKTGPAFGDWLHDPDTGDNISPCCDENDDCDDGNPCTRDVCVESEHRCYFEPLDPEECGTVPIPAVVPVPAPACTNDALEPYLCNIAGTPSHKTDFKVKAGTADLHHHMFGESLFAYRWQHGKASGSLGPCDGNGYLEPHGRVFTVDPLLNGLTGCFLSPPYSELKLGLGLAVQGLSGVLALAGPIALSEVMGKTEGSDGDTGFHLKRTVPGPGWPRWDVTAHEKGHGAALYKALQMGMRLIVVDMTGFEPLCQLVSPYADCNEMAEVDRQIDLAQQFANANSSWVEIALTPQHAVDIINSGKLAMVLAIETTDLFNSVFPLANNATPNPTEIAQLDTELNTYFQKGIRSVQIAHLMDNGFSGIAPVQPIFELLQYANSYASKGYWDSCVESNGCSSRPHFGFDVYEDSADHICKNNRGLTPFGEILVNKLMDKHMLIDIAHLSEKAIGQVYGLAKQNDYYPIFNSHARFRELEPLFGGSNKNVDEYSVPAWVVQKIRRTGGMVGLRTGDAEKRAYNPPSGTNRVDNTCAGSSRSIAQAYEFGRQGLKVDMGLGSDLNAPLVQDTRPRFTDRNLPGSPCQNPNGACSAGFKAEGICQAKLQSQKVASGFDTKGLADTGLEMDLVKDMGNLGANVSPLKNESAEDFLSMWDRTVNRSGLATPANDIDVSGISPYFPKGLRQQAYPAGCFGLSKKFCPASEELGDCCRFHDECTGNLACASGPCGFPKGKCVCTKDGGCPATQYCKLHIPILLFDNECLDKKANGAFCLHKKECLSGHCRLTWSGPRCVP